jgi:hypothetical protein
MGDLGSTRESWEEALSIYEELGDPNADRVRRWLAGVGAEAPNPSRGAGRADSIRQTHSVERTEDLRGAGNGLGSGKGPVLGQIQQELNQNVEE